MYDTARISSPYLSDSTANKIESFCTRCEGKILETGEIQYQFTNTQLSASYDYRISVQVCDYEYVKEGKLPLKKESPKYIIVECSLHKLLLGHNVYGGPERIHPAISYLVKFLEESFGMKLPYYMDWYMERLDIANIYWMENQRNVAQYNYQLKSLKFPKRKEPVPYPAGTGLYWKGADNTIKDYAKYYEFRKHDYRRIKKYLMKQLDLLYNEKGNNSKKWVKELKIKNRLKELEKLLEQSKGILRFEVELHKRVIKKIFEEKSEFENVIEGTNKLTIDRQRKGIKISKLNDDELKGYYGDCMKKLLKDCTFEENAMDTFFVSRILKEKYGSRKSNGLYGTWSKLCNNGYDWTKSQMSESTFFDHIKCLRDAGIKWNHATMKSNDTEKSLIKYKNRNPIEFFDYMTNKLCVSGECDIVAQKLNSVA